MILKGFGSSAWNMSRRKLTDTVILAFTIGSNRKKCQYCLLNISRIGD